MTTLALRLDQNSTFLTPSYGGKLLSFKIPAFAGLWITDSQESQPTTISVLQDYLHRSQSVVRNQYSTLGQVKHKILTNRLRELLDSDNWEEDDVLPNWSEPAVSAVIAAIAKLRSANFSISFSNDGELKATWFLEAAKATATGTDEGGLSWAFVKDEGDRFVTSVNVGAVVDFVRTVHC